MGCPDMAYIDETLTFSICTHDPDTGELTDADAAPVYWVYEDETGVSINASTPGSDIMALLDDAHTVGLYSETITCSVANGYENGKSYTIYIKATVGGDTGGITYGFKARTVPNNISVANIIAGIADGSYDLQEMLRVIFAVCAGKSSGGGTATLVFRDSADSKDRVTATVTAVGDRTATTLDAS